MEVVSEEWFDSKITPSELYRLRTNMIDPVMRGIKKDEIKPIRNREGELVVRAHNLSNGVWSKSSVSHVVEKVKKLLPLHNGNLLAVLRLVQADMKKNPHPYGYHIRDNEYSFKRQYRTLLNETRANSDDPTNVQFPDPALMPSLPFAIDDIIPQELWTAYKYDRSREINIGSPRNWTQAEEDRLVDALWVVVETPELGYDYLVAQVGTRSHYAVRFKVQRMFPGGFMGLLEEDDRQRRKVQHLVAGYRKWWWKLMEEDKKERIAKLHEGHQAWWDNLSEEDKKERIAKLHEGHQAWWVNLSEEDKKERIAKLLLL